jgi:hypothetical protein
LTPKFAVRIASPVAGASVRKTNKFSNPFYGLLLVAGLLFVVTATAYGVMYLQAVRGTDAAAAAAEEHPLLVWLHEHGNTALAAELALLAVGTIGAIGTDDYWQQRAKAEKENQTANER